MNHSGAPDVGAKRLVHYQFGPKSVSAASAGPEMLAGYVQITGLLVPVGRGQEVDVSMTAQDLEEAKLQGPVVPRAHTRFTLMGLERRRGRYVMNG